MHQVPKTNPTSTKVEAKTKKDKLELPELTDDEIRDILDPEALQQEVARMRLKGVSNPTAVEADLVDAVQWQDRKSEELKGLKLKDVSGDKLWLAELLSDMEIHEVSPSMTSDEARVILKELNKEIESMADEGYGPEARNYIYMMRRELEALINRL